MTVLVEGTSDFLSFFDALLRVILSPGGSTAPPEVYLCFPFRQGLFFFKMPAIAFAEPVVHHPIDASEVARGELSHVGVSKGTQNVIGLLSFYFIFMVSDVNDWALR